MTPVIQEVNDILAVIHREIRKINRPGLPCNDERLWMHNDTRRDIILQRWERLTAQLGVQHLALEAGFEMSRELQDLPGSEAGPEERAALEEALQAMLKAADEINEPEGDALWEHNDLMREMLMEGWGRLARATGNDPLAEKLGLLEKDGGDSPG